MTQSTSRNPSMPPEKAMKQTAGTPAEPGIDDEAPVGPNDGPTVDHGAAVSKGDAPIGEGRNDQSSPREPPHLGKTD